MKFDATPNGAADEISRSVVAGAKRPQQFRNSAYRQKAQLFDGTLE
jgi:hypothetical protein